MLSEPVMTLFWDFKTALGWTAIAGDGDRLQRVTFGHSARQTCVQSINEAGPGRRSNWNTVLAERLTAYAEGAVDDFLDVEIDNHGRTPFQQAVSRHCRQIPVGETRSYAELARLA